MSTDSQRMNHFIETQNDYLRQGFQLKKVSMSFLKINIYGGLVALSIVIIVNFIFNYFVKDTGVYLKINDDSFVLHLLFIFAQPIVAMFVSLFFHELIHATVFHILTQGKWSEKIYIGFSKKMLCPYCWLKKPSKRYIYALSVMAPFTFLGLGLLALSILTHNRTVLILSWCNIFACAGDIISFFLVLKNKGLFVIDNPVEVGFIMVV